MRCQVVIERFAIIVWVALADALKWPRQGPQENYMEQDAIDEGRLARIASARTHREAYPEQYTHPRVGERVVVHGRTGTIERVVSSRFGLLAQLAGESNTFYANASGSRLNANAPFPRRRLDLSTIALGLPRMRGVVRHVSGAS
jgi:hypothetical protein